MSYDLERLLVNTLFILLPIFLYQVFWLDKNSIKTEWNRPFLILLLSLSIILCMTFPIPFFPGFLFDLRQIPFIIGALYGGYKVGIWLFLSIIVYRLFLGESGLYVNFIVISLIFICIPLIHRSFKNLKFNQKILLVILLSEISAFLTIFLSHIFSGTVLQYEQISFNYFVIQGVSMALVTYLMETMLKGYWIRKELLRAEKMNVVSQIAASISHEVKNPITITQGFVELLEDEEDHENRKEFVGFALEELNRAKTIIDEFLTLAKPDLDSVEMINISHEIGYAANLMKPYAKTYSVKISMKELDEDCFIVGDRQKIRQCFVNIIKNCIEAMENGGELNLQAINKNNKILIDIVDTGIGMTSTEISQLGNPYYSTKEKGTGLGMMIVFNAIKKMNGEIKIESEKGKGTRFMISFPYAA
ncbi:MAG TPA: HAMP domain-containing sensor histidine kinase [Bacillota bacterium]|nr:HAMP domain-containing sensor histidine kinase [Bacillota bacterium]